MPVTVSLVTGSPYEAKIRDRLLGLLDRFDLRKWQFTDQVQIEAQAPSHSHPILTLTAYFPTDEILLSTYLHEQMHWFSLIPANVEATQRADASWRQVYPDVPIDYPEGCGSEESNYIHFTVIYFEYRALIDILGAEAARRIIEEKLERPVWCQN